MGFADLENLVCQTVLNRSDLAGPPVYDVTLAAPKPYFRPALQEAHDKIQKPYYKLGPDGKKEMVFGGNWRGMEITTEGNDPTYGNANFDGIVYPVGYQSMRYVYLINPITGKPHRHPLRSVSETEKATQFGESNGWGWCGYFDWGWGDWCANGCGNGADDCGQVRWLDKNNKFFLTHTPGPTVPPLTLRMVYNGFALQPTDVSYANNTDDWFTLNLFYELAALVTAIMWEHMLESENAKMSMEKAVQMLGDAWKLNQKQKAGSNDRVYAPHRRSTRGW